MLHRNHRWMGLLALITVISLILAACGEAEPEVIEKEVTRVIKETVVEKVVEKETVIETVVAQETVLQTVVEKETVVETVVQEVVVTATPEPTPEGPKVGGTLTIANYYETDSLDPHKVTNASGWRMLELLGASLVTYNPEGEIVPYLAESWEISEDGLTYDFKLKKGITFHDGTPLTAHEYAWTLNRMITPDVFTAATSQPKHISAEALDDYTLRLQTEVPQFYFLSDLTDACIYQPLLPAEVEKWGDQYGQHPMGVGPFKFREWIRGDRIVLERNPDYNWGPAFLENTGPYYIETLVYRYIPEETTTVSGLEAGDIDMAAIPPKDLDRFQDSDRFQIFEYTTRGMDPAVLINNAAYPFDDVLVRRAFNLATDREAVVKVVLQGHGVPQYGPLSPSVIGYWPKAEEIGYHYDLEAAKALLNEAGYTYDADGMLERDGEPLKIVMKISENRVQMAEVLQAQWKELGADVEIQILETATKIHDLIAGDYEAMIVGYGSDNASVLAAYYHTGSMNLCNVDDPVLEELLDASLTTIDPQQQQEIVNEAQQRIIEQAVVIPVYAAKNYLGLNTRVKGAVPNPNHGNGWPYLAGVYIDE